MKPHVIRSLFLLLFVGPLACDAGSATMPNPLVRLDVSSKLPPKVRQRLPSAIDLDCHDEVLLQADGAKQAFTINWRVVDVDGARYMMAIDVQPSGTTSGAKSPKASGTIGQLKREGQGKAAVDSVPVVISWQAQKGCSQLKETKMLEVRSDHASCKSSQPAGLLKSAPK